MARAIEFRGWNSQTKNMLTMAHLLRTDPDTYSCVLRDCLNGFKAIVTLEQFTGLHDKNGVKIFEGDIVKWDDNSDGKYWRVAIVSLDPDLRFKCFDCPLIENSSAHGHTFKFGSFIYTDTHNHLYVIGNIHSNPELLEKK